MHKQITINMRSARIEYVCICRGWWKEVILEGRRGVPGDLYQMELPLLGLVRNEQVGFLPSKKFSIYTSRHAKTIFTFRQINWWGTFRNKYPLSLGNHIKIPGECCPSVGHRKSSWPIAHESIGTSHFSFGSINCIVL